MLWFLAYLFAYSVAAPVLTLVHELGHALVTVAGTRARVCIHLGREPPLVRLRVGRVSFALRPWPGYVGFVRSESEDDLSRRRRIAGTLAGPLASALSAVGLLLLAFSIRSPWQPFAIMACAWAVIQFGVTVMPFTYPQRWRGYGGRPSDGLRVLRMLRSRSRDDVAKSE